MDYSFAWKAVLIVLVGSTLLRLAGRKSIAQMTVAQTIIMIAIGNLLIQPVSERGIWITFLIGAILVLTLLVIEYVQVHSNSVEKLITGKAVVVVENGILIEENLKSIRMTVDQLEIQLRQANIENISDIKMATIEANGRIGYLLMDHAKPTTRKDLDMLIQLINAKLPGGSPIPHLPTSAPASLFEELTQEENKPKSPPHLR